MGVRCAREASLNRTTLSLIALLACAPETDPEPLEALPGVALRFEVNAEGDFFAEPYPADHRLVLGAPPMDQMAGIDATPLLEDLARSITLPGYPVVPVGWFSFGGYLERPDGMVDWPADVGASVQLVDIDPDSPQRGRRIPTTTMMLEPDRYVEGEVLAVAPRPGFVLRADTTYAFLVRRDLGDVDGEPLGVGLPLRQLLHGQTPDTPWGEALATEWQPLVAVLPELGLAPDDLAAATVFTTGDAVAEVAALSEAVREDVGIPALSVSFYAGVDRRPGYCELRGTLTVPQYQRGTPPFASDGAIVLDEDGVPIVQREESIPVVVTVPASPMPAEGYPLAMYFHGSGGRSDQVVSRSPILPSGQAMAYGHGPAWVLAEQGIAAAGSAHPVNPERVEGANAFAYLNLTNLVVFRNTFQQGIFEQRLYLDALLDLRLSPESLADCEGVSLPAGSEAYHFDPDSIVAMGQSMGGMYVNLVSAVDPRITAVVPTGAGGHWSRMGLDTPLFGTGGTTALIAALLKTEAELSFLHPAMHIVQTAWEVAEPLGYLPRLAARPLPGHPARDIYEPVGFDDIYFPPGIFDAMALAYDTELSGEVVWSSMDELLSLDGRARQSYPVVDNRVSENGERYTASVAQYRGDGLADPHVIFVQLEEVRTQYGCFLRSHLDGEATVVDPAEGCE